MPEKGRRRNEPGSYSSASDHFNLDDLRKLETLKLDPPSSRLGLRVRYFLKFLLSHGTTTWRILDSAARISKRVLLN